MKVTKVFGVLAAGAVLFAAATGLTSDRETRRTTLADYDMQSGELWAYRPNGTLTTYLNQATTEYLEADLSSYEPPDPCLRLADAWNRTVEYDQKHGKTSTQMFDRLLEAMSARGCSADLTSVTSGSPYPLVKITPTSGTSGSGSSSGGSSSSGSGG